MLAAVCAVAAAGCSTTETDPTPAPAPPVVKAKEPDADAGRERKVATTTVDFTKDIKPLLANKCTICHNQKTLPTRPNFETAELALGGTAIVPGAPEKSRMVQVVKASRELSEQAMPPVSHELTKQEIALLRTWIAEGAQWPSGEAGRVVPAFIPEE